MRWQKCYTKLGIKFQWPHGIWESSFSGNQVSVALSIIMNNEKVASLCTDKNVTLNWESSFNGLVRVLFFYYLDDFRTMYEVIWLLKIVLSLQCLRLHCTCFRRHHHGSFMISTSKLPKLLLQKKKKITVHFLNYDEKNENIAENPHKCTTICYFKRFIRY